MVASSIEVLPSALSGAAAATGRSAMATGSALSAVRLVPPPASGEPSTDRLVDEVRARLHAALRGLAGEATGLSRQLSDAALLYLHVDGTVVPSAPTAPPMLPPLPRLPVP